MRITQSITYNSYISDIMERQESLFRLQKQISTSKRINTISDDPVAAGQVLSARSTLAGLEQYDRNIDSGLAYLSMAEKALGDAKNVISGLSELAISTVSGTVEAPTRKNAAITAQNFFDQLAGLGNTNLDGKYMFSGYLTDTQTFTSAGAYQGDANKYQIQIGSNTTATIGINGGEVFKGTAGGIDIFQVITDFITALNANDTAGIQSAITDLETSFNQISSAVSDIGGKVLRLDGTKSDISNFKLDLHTNISSLEDADLAKVISEFQLGQNALEGVLASSSKVMSLNIFDYL